MDGRLGVRISVSALPQADFSDFPNGDLLRRGVCSRMLTLAVAVQQAWPGDGDPTSDPTSLARLGTDVKLRQRLHCDVYLTFEHSDRD